MNLKFPGNKSGIPDVPISTIQKSIRSTNIKSPIILDRRQHLSLLVASLPIPLFLNTPTSHALTTEDVTPEISQSPQLSQREQHIVDVFARCDPSVVTIYDVTLPSRIPSGPGSAEQVEGNGSGWIFDANNGYIVTNYHCLAGSLQNTSTKVGPLAKVALVYIQGPDGIQQAFDGLLVGTDRRRDIAVLKVDAPPSIKLRALSLGDSSQVRIGQQTLAIGAPFGFAHTLTTGVVSATNRGFTSQVGTVINGMQTSAALNPGNSGGPLLDSAGRCIGMNTAIFTNTGTSVNIGFSIPINTIKVIVPQLIRHNKVLRPSLGITPATEPVARALNITTDGVLIQSVEANGPAQIAGLKGIERTLGGIVPGDCIIRIDHKPVHGLFDASTVLDELSVGDRVEVEVLSGGSGEKRVVEVILGEEKSDD